jgi:hypothetical protein
MSDFCYCVVVQSFFFLYACADRFALGHFPLFNIATALLPVPFLKKRPNHGKDEV